MAPFAINSSGAGTNTIYTGYGAQSARGRGVDRSWGTARRSRGRGGWRRQPRARAREWEWVRGGSVRAAPAAGRGWSWSGRGWGRQGWWRHEPVGRARRSERRGEEQGEEVSAGHGRGCARASQSPHAPHTLWRIGGALCALAYGVAWWRASRVGGRVAVVLGVVTFGACRVLVISTSSSSASPAHMT